MTDDIVNHFVHRSAAKRYAAARPFFHPGVMGKIVQFTGRRFERGLDVGCGTGQSSRALAEIAERVEGVDVSEEMLSETRATERISFRQAPAEKLPFEDGAFDLMTVGLAFHWFDQRAFLAEAARVLNSGGWLVIYTDGFCGEMVENAEFRVWAHEVYPKRFAAPPRRALGVSAELVKPYGFDLRGSERFDHVESMSAEELTAYLLTQSNVIHAVESGTLPIEAAADWILKGVKSFFRSERAGMKFAGMVWYMQRD